MEGVSPWSWQLRMIKITIIIKKKSFQKTASSVRQGVESAEEEPCAEGNTHEKKQRENKALGSDWV